ncbi:MAG TPA: ParB/RepB/Spo0J family partition protein [Candidatus Copromorpha excrementigallinarum]|uniref:ParB/RepB/Spo0J family partition protein n=1 Tax=Candidatus Allocopromorpha excrementigallinarum TaxID=2840742 RepID=A0A9D1I0K2_9FIRM|nr:ParB/RepB/Spo0J family partition protein [Candidatus Copromorpha excrementigallinarum]
MAAQKKTRGLGKGLDALFGDVEVKVKRAEETPEAEGASEDASSGREGINYIDINHIKPNSNQPRKTFDEEKLNELADSIMSHGLIQPVVLRAAGRGYEIVAGERRWRAARRAGLKEIPCIVRELSDEENMLLAIIENMQREDLNPIEEAEGLNQMIETYGLTQSEVSKSVGKSRPYITNSLRLLKLPEKIRGFVSEGSISAGHARALVSVEDEERQEAIAEAVIRDGLSVRQIEKMAQEKKASGRKSPASRSKPADVRSLEEELKDVLGTRVNLSQRGKKGKIEIEFYSREELERLIDLLKTLA